MNFEIGTGQGKSIFDLREVIAEGAAFGEEKLTILANGEGPTVLLCGGIHGDEYEPQIVLRRLAEELRPDDVRGRLIIVPSINFPGAQNGGRLSTLDGHNMNRVFTGDGSGTATQRLAAFLHDRVFPACDLLVDVHSGGSVYRVVPMIFGFSDPGCRVDERALEALMESWGYAFIQYVEGVPTTAVGAALKANLASVEIEGGSGGDVTADELRTMEDGVRRGLAHFGVLRSSGKTRPVQRTPVRVRVGAANEYTAPSDGVLEHAVGLGDKVETGQIVARIHPVSGTSAEPTVIRSGADGYVLRQSTRAFLRKGDLIGNTGSPVR